MYNSTSNTCFVSLIVVTSWYGEIRSIITMYIPLILNIITYSFIIYKVNKRKLSLNSTISSIKSIFICVCFTLSWVPSMIDDKVFKGRLDDTSRRATQITYYLNCLLDPIFYSISTRAMARILMMSSREYKNSIKQRRRVYVSGINETRNEVAKTDIALQQTMVQINNLVEVNNYI